MWQCKTTLIYACILYMVFNVSMEHNFNIFLKACNPCKHKCNPCKACNNTYLIKWRFQFKFYPIFCKLFNFVLSLHTYHPKNVWWNIFESWEDYKEIYLIWIVFTTGFILPKYWIIYDIWIKTSSCTFWKDLPDIFKVF